MTKTEECDICGTYVNKRYIKTHLLIHSDKKLYSCSVCGLRVINKSSLKNLMQTLTKEHMIVCEICNKTFNQNSNYKRHLKTHDT